MPSSVPSSRSRSVNAWVEPESNQTSKISMTCSYSAGSTIPPRKRSFAPSSYQASAPSTSKASTMRWFTSALRNKKPSSVGNAPFLVKHVRGTPHARWRDRTQSGRASIMECNRLRPVCGVQLTLSISVSARSRMVLPWVSCPSPTGLSIAANHCGVLR